MQKAPVRQGLPLGLEAVVEHPRAADLLGPQPEGLAEQLLAVGQAVELVVAAGPQADDLRVQPAASYRKGALNLVAQHRHRPVESFFLKPAESRHPPLRIRRAPLEVERSSCGRWRS